jgi:DNA-binding XRE family transcriptional regulator
MWGTNKKRSNVGKFIDKNGYTQEELCKAANIGRNTASRICSDPDYTPSTNTIRKVMKAIREIEPNAKTEDFFDL